MDIELSLFIFIFLETLGAGLLIGAFTLVWALWRDTEGQGDMAFNKPLRRITWLGTTLLGLGLLSSLFHLGHPERFFLALTNIGGSWLSREGALGLLALLVAIVNAWTWRKLDGPAVGADKRQLWIGGVLASLVLLLLFATSMIYTGIRAIPLWSSANTILLFFASALALGFILLPLLAWKPLQEKPQILSQYFHLTIGSIIGLMIVNGLIFIELNIGLTMAAQRSFDALVSEYLPITLSKLILGLAVPLVLVLVARSRWRKSGKSVLGLWVCSFVFLLIGEILGKVLFFLPAYQSIG